jgi:hypothetical protein
MITPIEFVLVAVIIVKNPSNNALELDYAPVDHFRSMQSCIVERNKLQKKMIAGKTYICLKVDRD